MENDAKTVDRIYLKPNAFDLVLEVVAGLLLLFLWAIALGKFVFPESYTDRFDQSHAIFTVIGLSLSMVLFYRTTRYPFHAKHIGFVTITQENAERQYRISARMTKFIVIIFTTIAGFLTREVVPVEVIRSLWKVSMIYLLCFCRCLLAWSFVRPWMLR